MRNFAAVNYSAKSRVSEVIDIGNKDTGGLLVEIDPIVKGLHLGRSFLYGSNCCLFEHTPHGKRQRENSFREIQAEW
jgi:hypothetical protein